MNDPDQDTVLRTVQDARRILGEYIEPGPRDPAESGRRRHTGRAFKLSFSANFTESLFVGLPSHFAAPECFLHIRGR